MLECMAKMGMGIGKKANELRMLQSAPRLFPVFHTEIAHARFYSAGLGKFIQPDTIVPDVGSAFGFNRYVYVRNNPIVL